MNSKNYRPNRPHECRSSESHTGIVISFNNKTGKGGGYGFLHWEGGADIFVHISDVVGATEKNRPALYAGDTVSFEISQDRNQRLRAVQVRVQLRAEQTEVHHQPRRD